MQQATAGPAAQSRAPDASVRADSRARGWARHGGDSPRGRETPMLLPECAAIAGFIAVIWASIWLMLHQQYQATEHAAVRDTRNLARAFEENTERIAAGIDQTLLSIRASYAENGESFRLADWLKRHPLPDRFTVQITIIGPDGISRESSLAAGSAERVDLSDRPHFRAQLDPTRDDLFISKPVLGRISKQWTVQFTRKLLTRNHGFAGVVVLSLGCDQLSRFYDTLELGQGIVMLAGADGVVRARAPLADGVIGADIAHHPAFSTLRDQPYGEYRLVSPFDGVSRLLSFRRLADLPLVVIVGVGADEMFEPYRQARFRSVVTGGIASVFVLFLGTFWIVRRRRWLLAQRALGVTLESISQGIVMVTAAGQVPVINRRAAELLGMPARIGQSGALDSQTVLSGTRAVWRPTLAPLDHAAGGRESVTEITSEDGKTIEVRRAPTPFGGMVVTYTDITDGKLAEARILHLALHDGLTGLPNRILLNQRIEQAIAGPGNQAGEQSEPPVDPFAIFCLDLDGFKAVNDTMGHDAGDLVLARVAERLRGLVRPADTLARTGGDSFSILVGGPIQPAAAEEVAQRLLSDIVMPVDLGGYVADIGACIGIAMFPVDGGDGRALLKNAATALSVAKSGQRGSFRRFETWMDQSAVERRALERDLRLAIEADQITVFFQPQFATDTLRVTGFEALARWRHPERGFVPPGVFIPLAEECGLILRIGRAVLERACAEAALWRPPLRVAVNLSPVQFLDANLLSWLSGVLERIGLPASRLELEVTEGVLIKDEDSALGALRELKALGVELALDDFGTGYSGLSYLRRFPFDVLKIDKTFVVAQQWDFSTRAIVDAVLTMSIRMGLRVVAEGIETEEQLALLRDQGASDVQGFLLARPMPGKEVQPFLDSVAARAEQTTAPPGVTHDGATKPRPAGHGGARRGADDPTEAQPLAPAAEAAPTVTGGRRRRRSDR